MKGGVGEEEDDVDIDSETGKVKVFRPIGAWKCNFLPPFYEIMANRINDRRTDGLIGKLGFQ